MVMRKWVSIGLLVAMFASFSTVASAAPAIGSETGTEVVDQIVTDSTETVDEARNGLTDGQKRALKAVRERLQAQREKGQALVAELKANREELRAIFAALKESGDREAVAKFKLQMQDVKAILEQIHSIRQENKALWEQAHEARANRDFDALMRALVQIESNRDVALRLLQDAVNLTDRIIASY